MGVGKENVASCGWGGTLRLRAKVVDARDRGVKTAEKLVGHGLELGERRRMAPSRPFARRNRIVGLRRVVRFSLLTCEPSPVLVHSSRRAHLSAFIDCPKAS